MFCESGDRLTVTARAVAQLARHGRAMQDTGL